MSMYPAIDIGASFLGVRRFLVLAATCVCSAASSDVLAAYLLTIEKAWERRAGCCDVIRLHSGSIDLRVNSHQIPGI